MTFEEKVRQAIQRHVGQVVPPEPDVGAVLGRRRRRLRLRVVAIPVAVVAIVSGAIGGAGIVMDENGGSAGDERLAPLNGMDFSKGLRAYKSPDGKIFLGGRRFDASDLSDLDTDATATPRGIVYFDADGRAHLLDQSGERTAIGQKPEDAPDEFSPSAKADATRPLAVWTEYYDDRVTVRAYDLDSEEVIGSYDVTCGSGCADVRVVAMDSGHVFIENGDGSYAWDATRDADEVTRVAGPGTDIVDVHAKTMLYSGKTPSPGPGTPIDDSWQFVKGAIDAQLSHDGRYVLNWSSTLKPTRGADAPVELEAGGTMFYSFDTDGSVLAATAGNPAKVYDCVLPSGKCTRLDDAPTVSGDLTFVGADM